MSVTVGVLGVSSDQGTTDVEEELRLARVNVGDMIVVLVSPQLSQTEHVIIETSFTQHLKYNMIRDYGL